MTTPHIAIIGAGHMGMSLLGGLMKGFSENTIFLSDPSVEKLENAARQFKIKTTTSNVDAIEHAEIIILAVKPDKVAEVAKEISETLKIKKTSPLIISVAAGIRESHIQKSLGEEFPIIRAMSNTAALIGCGATALYGNALVSSEQRFLAETILQGIGLVAWVDNEKLIDAVTALSGSGPAYFFLLMEAMQQEGEKLGLPAEISHMLTMQTAYGAACLARESDLSITELRRQAMTPGGAAEQALRVFEENNFRQIVAEALGAAANRAKELGA